MTDWMLQTAGGLVAATVGGVFVIAGSWSQPDVGEVIAGLGLAAAGLGFVFKQVLNMMLERQKVMVVVEGQSETLKRIEDGQNAQAGELTKLFERSEEQDRRQDDVEQRLARVEGAMGGGEK